MYSALRKVFKKITERVSLTGPPANTDGGVPRVVCHEHLDVRSPACQRSMETQHGAFFFSGME